MHAMLAFLFLVLFVFGLLVLPLHFEALIERFRARVVRFALGMANRATFCASQHDGRNAILSMRLWFVVSAAVFTYLGLQDGAMIRNQPYAVVVVAGYGALSLAMGSLVLFAFALYNWILPGMRGYATLSRCGFRGLRVLDSRRQLLALSGDLSERAQETSKIGVVDVNGYELFVNGPGASSGVLNDVLRQAPELPVFVLLLNPQSSERDPDRRAMTVYESVLAETGLKAPLYMVRLRKTLEAIDEMNNERDPTAQITVRFYNQRPTMRAVFFDDSVVVFPPQADHRTHEDPCLEIGRRSDVPTFYETFRRDFSRMWQSGVGQSF